MSRRGISLIELLVTVVLLSITMAAVMNAFISGLDAETHLTAARDSQEEVFRLEDQLAKLISYADLNDGNSVFQSPIPTGTQNIPPDTNDGLPAGSSSLVFTTWSRPPNLSYLAQTESPWETLNGRYGVQGGTSEIALSTVPVGDAGAKRGLFIREQRPPPADPSSGGTERLYSAKIRSIRFEFYDGTAWQTAWDSKNGQKGTLPTAVRITYLLAMEKIARTMTVRLRTTTGGTKSS